MSAYHLFSCYGIELEYMIVDRDSLNVQPITDRLIEMAHGSIVSEIERGAISWSNELVGHVVELKTNGPAGKLQGLSSHFHQNVVEINQMLQSLNGQLMPTAMHPWMNPQLETRLWAHDYNEVYEAYDRIFSCKGHGWSNVQSVHLNLPFADDAEFARLHASIRLILPLLPALCASSPYVDGRFTGRFDSRLSFYETNQKTIPVIAGGVIPESVLSQAEYQVKIFDPISEAIKPHDPDQILEPEWLNSRGAIARFDRGAIEIRVMDIQECPRADLSVAGFVVALLKKLCSRSALPDLPSETLKSLFDLHVSQGTEATVDQMSYLKVFDLNTPLSTDRFLRYLKEEWLSHDELDHEALDVIIRQGSLSQRLLKRMGQNPQRTELKQVYGELCRCLEENRQFEI